LQEKTYSCGTLRRNRKNTDPPNSKGPNKLKTGDIVAKSSNGVLTQYWKDKKIVSVITTIHDNQIEQFKLKKSNEKFRGPLQFQTIISLREGSIFLT